VSVKLVAEAGIGTVASGVAKGNADIIQVYILVIFVQ
jgi:glutamate synthase domain-containing protein 2